MTPLDDTDETLAPLRDLPLEIDLEQVAHMVAAFPLAVSATGWLASLKTNLNSILMISIGTLTIGTAIHFMVFGTPHVQAAPKTRIPEIQAPAQIVEVPQAATPLPTAQLAPPVANIVRASAPTEPVTQEPATTPAPLAANEATPLAFPASPGPIPLPAATLTQPSTTEKTYDVKDFNGVASFCDAEIFVEEGPWSVSANGDPTLLNSLEIKVENGVLKISMKNDTSINLKDRESVKVEVHLPQLTRIDQSGSGNIRVGELNGSAMDFAVNVLGSGDVDLKSVQAWVAFTLLVQGSGDINCRSALILGRTSVTVLGSGDVKVSGTTPSIEVLIQGSGNVNVSGLKAQDGNVTILGSGDASVTCTGKLERLVQGSGIIQNAGSTVGTEDSNAK